VELLPFIALALALWALRRTHDHERLRQRVDALEAQMTAARAAGTVPVTTAPPAEIPPLPAEASEDAVPGLEPGDVASEPPPPDVAPPFDAVRPPAPPPRGQIDWPWIARLAIRCG
jgi:hypothetical protein